MKQKPKKERILYINLGLLILMLASLASAQENHFNLEVQIAQTHKNIQAGEELWFTTKILNLAGTQRMDISLKYEILNSGGEIISSKTETVAIETQASFVGNLKVPENAMPGSYSLQVILIANSQEEASGKDSFTVIEDSEKTSKITIAIIILAGMVIIILAVYLSVKLKKISENILLRKKIHNLVKNKQKIFENAKLSQNL
jgi:hypothetical protein